jgi:hypothetical protein
MDEAVRVALRDQLAGNVMPRHDEGVLVAKDAGLQRGFVIGKMRQGGMQGTVNREAVLVRTDFQHAPRVKTRIAADEGIGWDGHG